MSSSFIKKFQNQSVDSIVNNISSEFPFHQDSLKKDLKEIASLGDHLDIIDSDKELLRLGELFVDRYPVLANNYNIGQYDLLKFKKAMGHGISLSEVPERPTERQIGISLNFLFVTLERDSSLSEFTFLDKKFKSGDYSAVNLYLEEMGSSYRCFFGQASTGQFGAGYGRIVNDEKFDLYGLEFSRVELELENQFGFVKNPSWQTYSINNFRGSIYIFRNKLEENIGLSVGKILTDTSIFPFDSRVRTAIAQKVDSDIKHDGKKWIDDISDLVFWYEKSRLILQYQFGKLSEHIKSKLVDSRHFRFGHVVDRIEEDLYVFDQILQLKESNPEKAKRILCTWFVLRYTPISSERSLYQDPNYQAQLASMILSSSSIVVDEEGQIEVNWFELENNFKFYRDQVGAFNHKLEYAFKLALYESKYAVNYEKLPAADKLDSEFDSLLHPYLPTDEEIEEHGLNTEKKKKDFAISKAQDRVIQMSSFKEMSSIIFRRFQSDFNNYFMRFLGLNEGFHLFRR